MARLILAFRFHPGSACRRLPGNNHPILNHTGSARFALPKKLAGFREDRHKTERVHDQTGFMTSWQGKVVSVRAHYVPRFVWTTASIDVYLDDRCILRTGGQLKLTGSHSTTFTDGGTEHRMELTWGGSGGFRFPYQLRIDGVLVADAHVAIENWGMIFIPATLIVLPLFSCLAVLVLLVWFGLRRMNPGG
jgi:hypothetical protein